MQYKSLKPIYHKNRSQYEEIYHARFHGEFTSHLPVDIHNNPAFYIANEEMLNIISDIMRLNSKILLIAGKLPVSAEHQLFKTCLINEIAMTNEMEGVHSSRKEIGDIFDGVKGTPNENRLIGLVQKYILLKNGSYPDIRSCEDIRNIFDDLVRQEIEMENEKELPDGELFRKGSVSVYNGSQKEIHKGLYPEEKMISVMQASIGILNNDTVNILIRIALFHYLFGYIHPFYNGNGRVSRFISSSLIANALNPYISYRLSQTIKNEKKKYYDAFEICNHPLNKGDLTPFILIFLKIVKKAAIEIKENLEQKYGDYQHYEQIIESLNLKENESLLLSVVMQTTLFSWEYRGLSTEELRKVFDISRATLNNRIKNVNADNPFILTTQIGRKNYYTADLELLEQFSK